MKSTLLTALHTLNTILTYSGIAAMVIGFFAVCHVSLGEAFFSAHWDALLVPAQNASDWIIRVPFIGALVFLFGFSCKVLEQGYALLFASDPNLTVS